MPIKRPQLANGEIYHIVIRAIEDLKLFRNKEDYFRKVHNLFEFNDKAPASREYRDFRVNLKKRKNTKIVFGYSDVNLNTKSRKRELIVEILAFCLMPNHVHLLIRQLRDGGISKFMRKIGAGYGLYYNQKYKRQGHVFQGKYRAVHIKDDKQLITVFVYIHTNPVALIVPNWKKKGIKDFKKAESYIENYRWSSYLDYLGKRNFPSITSREFLIKEMGGRKGCREFVNDWLQFKKELADFDKVAIE